MSGLLQDHENDTVVGIQNNEVKNLKISRWNELNEISDYVGRLVFCLSLSGSVTSH